MKVDHHPHISLAETRAIIQYVKNLSTTDLSVFSLANLQLLISNYIHSTGMQFPDILISRMNDYPDVIEDLLCYLDVPDPEMFRDPELWLILNSEIMPGILAKVEKPDIWFPSCSTGEELYSFVIMALENGYREKIRIFASTPSKIRLKEAERGLFMGDNVDIIRENYARVGGKIEIEHYIEKIDRYIVRKEAIRKNIDFSIQPEIPQKCKQSVDLILYTNRLIYFNAEASLKVINNLIDSLSTGGFLVLGYKEEIRDEKQLKKVKLVGKEGKIYQKI